MVLLAGMVALVLTPGGRLPPPQVTARAVAGQPEQPAARSTTHTHTSSGENTPTPCPRRLLGLFPECSRPTDEPTAPSTFSFTNSAAQVSIPPTATPRPAPTPAPTAETTPIPSDLGDQGGGAATRSSSGSAQLTHAALPATGRDAPGGGITRPLLAVLAVLLLLGGGAGLLVLRLR